MRDYNIESDLKQEKFQSLKLVQGDRGNKIKINVYEDGQPVNLTGCSITAKYKRSDGKTVDGTVENISGNSFDAVIDSDITKVVGTLKMLFSIEKDDVKVSTFLLLADVREGLLENTGSSGGSTGGGEVTVDLSNYYKKNETYSKSQIDSQFKDIANNQPTDLSLDSDTNLLQLVNSKGSKLGNGITLPISSGGGTSQYLHIKYSSTGAPQLAGQMSDTPNAYIGLSVDTNADSPTNPQNYTWYKWKGDNGDTGATPQLAIGEVTTLNSGSSATASITGTTENPVLNLGIPKGDTGAGGSSEKKWEKIIETSELAEDTAYFLFTQTDNGETLDNFEFFKIFAKIIGGASETTYGYLRVCIDNKNPLNTGSHCGQIKSGSGYGSKFIYSCIDLDFKLEGYVFTNFLSGSESGFNTGMSNTAKAVSVVSSLSSIEVSNMNTSLGAGSQVTIYAKRK